MKLFAPISEVRFAFEAEARRRWRVLASSPAKRHIDPDLTAAKREPTRKHVPSLYRIIMHRQRYISIIF